ncbi:carbon-phosphorus lyase complex subunit PhnI [Oceanibacterium hippocampi]|uniref:Alpha-D-ribose 1-methylphosphonate 5-triphosphate synthase subunit PhnI n=1 Tax=Oceanibacterium hippocampi TaxID=745714 RepID=A0A1Y5TXD3_9PROT|nr:carbon-phosphorus lyase complex subunit PhnI [Oceanibacterium hippocampi]SLN76110.1 Alpha-D-ribose 1-methylphosphonate 5-triphosphate synthase subunit PhnI [Oceanibacterium hippocampi]
MYVAVKGGEQAIENSHRLIAAERRGDPAVPELDVRQIREQMRHAVARVMAEGSLYDPDLAALAIKQAQGDLVEAIFLVRAYRTTLRRFAVSRPIDSARMAIGRRISATFKDLPGGQVLGGTYDYTHRLLDHELAGDGAGEAVAAEAAAPLDPEMPRVSDILDAQGLLEAEMPDDESDPVADLTRDPLRLPGRRDQRLQNLARADEGFLLALGYSTQRGYGRTHPFAGEIRQGTVAVEIEAPELGFAIDIGDIEVTECELVNQFKGSTEQPPQFTRGYGLAFGRAERKAMAMALVDRSLRAAELGEETGHPAQDEEFVLSHSDNVEASGFVQHLKLPHYIDFQSELHLVRRLRADFDARRTGTDREAAE